MRRTLLLFAVVSMWGFTLLSLGQEQRKPVSISTTARLAAAKTALLRKAGGSDIPYKVMESSLTAWGHFTLVDDRNKADVIIDVAAPYDDASVEMSSVAGASPLNGDSATGNHPVVATRQLYVPRIVLTISDARSNLRLWSGSERAKYAIKEKTRQDYLVEASQRVFSKLRDSLEPPPTPAAR
jgi:hypothetical protein